MTNNSSSRSILNSKHGHSLGTFALCLASFTNAYLMASLSPYAGYMVMYMVPSTTTESAGAYAGWLIGSFFIGRFCTAYIWGILADRYGRIFVLEFTLGLSLLFSLLFGTSTSFYMAMLWRFFMGMSSGIMSITKALASEISKPQQRDISLDNNDISEQQQQQQQQQGDDDDENGVVKKRKKPIVSKEILERRAVGLVMGMRSFGLLVCPAIGGFLAEPLQQYNPSWIISGTKLHTMLELYPFLPPNLMAAILCIIAGIACYVIVDETLPEERRRSPTYIPIDIIQGIQSYFAKKKTTTTKWNNKNNAEAYEGLPSEETALVGDTNGSKEEEDEDDEPKKPASVWEQPLTRWHLWSIWFFSFLSTFVDEAFPLFCISELGGLALRESQIGTIMLGAGIVFAMGQYPTYSYLMSKCGQYKTASLGSIIGTLPALLIPISMLFRTQYITLYLYLGFIVGTIKSMHGVYYASTQVAVNKTVDTTQRASVNALMMVGSSVGRGAGPIIAGTIIAFSYSGFLFPVRYGSFMVWSLVPLMGIAIAMDVLKLERAVSTANALDNAAAATVETPTKQQEA